MFIYFKLYIFSIFWSNIGLLRHLDVRLSLQMAVVNDFDLFLFMESYRLLGSCH